jgi:hypothetical protein
MNTTRVSTLSLISLLRLCSSEIFDTTTSIHKAEVQGTLVEVVCNPITLQSNGLSYIILQFVYLANGLSITPHYECTGNNNIQLMEWNSASHSRDIVLNSQPEKWMSRLRLHAELGISSRQMSIFQSYGPNTITILLSLITLFIIIAIQDTINHLQ